MSLAGFDLDGLSERSLPGRPWRLRTWVPSALIERLPAIAATLGAVCLVVLRGVVPFPVTNDHAYFLPASWWFAQGGGLANPWMQGGFNHAFNWHGFLQPQIVGSVARALGGGWGGVYLALNLLGAATLFAIVALARRMKASPLRATALVLIAFGVLLDARARPEVLAMLETVCMAACMWSLFRNPLASRMWALCAGGLFATLVVTHPAVAMFTLVAVATGVLVHILKGRFSIRAAVQLVLAMGLAFIVSLAALFIVAYGEAASVWVKGIIEAGQMTLGRNDTDGFLKYYLANRFIPGLALVFAIAAMLIWALFRPSAAGPGTWAGYALMLFVGAGLGALCYRFALRVPATYYNLSGMLVALALLSAVVSLQARARLVADGVLAVLALGALFGAVVWIGQALAEWPILTASRAELAAAIEADDAAGRTICADSAALGAVDSARVAHGLRVSIPLADGPKKPNPAVCSVYYALQSNDAAEPPHPVPGFTLERMAYRHSLAWLLFLRPWHFGFARWVADNQPAP